MRRAVLQALRPARRPIVRKAFRHRGSVLLAPWSNPHAAAAAAAGGGGLRTFISRRDRAAASTLISAMQLRSFSAAIIAAAVATGAWYYKAQAPLRADSGAAGPSRGLSTSSAYSSSNLATSPTKSAAEEAVLSTRRALVVEQGQLYSGTIVGDGPLSKETDDYGRKVLEMLTPEQATQKLRKNEESWLVGRGEGVVRYDTVQIPSNDPIEDDHSEKIVEDPTSVAAATEDSKVNSSDWMFWGVYDGHR
jgi:pyruvate dehydrogenase phosphatase